MEDAKERSCPKGIVVNLSLTSDTVLKTMNDACANLVKRGMMVVAAAGNFNRDASNESPASEPLVCTVGGTSSDDNRFGLSNYGPLVDIHAPAFDVVSTTVGGGSVSNSQYFNNIH